MAARLALPALVCRTDEARPRTRPAARVSDPAAAADARRERWPAPRTAVAEPAEVRGTVAPGPGAPPAATVRRALEAVRG
jgi:hypothetical protein